MVGIISLVNNGVSYCFASRKFSVRHEPALDQLVKNKESGAQPLHSSLGRTELAFDDLTKTAISMERRRE